MPVFIFVASFDLEMSKKNSGGATVVHRHLSPEQNLFTRCTCRTFTSVTATCGLARVGMAVWLVKREVFFILFLLKKEEVLAVSLVAIAAIIRHLQLHNFVAAKCTFHHQFAFATKNITITGKKRGWGGGGWKQHTHTHTNPTTTTTTGRHFCNDRNASLLCNCKTHSNFASGEAIHVA